MDAESIRSEIAFRFSRSSGPGGQHAQKSSTRAEALFDVEESQALSAAEKKRVLAKLGPVVRAAAQDERSQLRNRELATERVDRAAARGDEGAAQAPADEADGGVQGATARREEAPRSHEAAAPLDGRLEAQQ